MKILIVVDKGGTAIDRLAQSVKKHLSQHEIIIFPIHPKRNDIETMIEAQRLMTWCDIIDIHYWKSGQVLRTSFPNEFNEKPKILFHFNPYDAVNDENKLYDIVVANNNTIHNDIPYATLVPMGIDLSFFKYNPDYTEDKVVNMSVARIEGKKGVLEVAKACKELGYKFRLVGRVSKGDYMKEVMGACKDNIEFWEDATDEKLREVYYSSAIHVCNSVDGFESGTLPILENMACGIPVLTRPVGHVPDLFNGGNMVVREGSQDNLEELKTKLKEMMENREWRIGIRERAWETVRNRDDRKMAQDVNSLYYKTFKNGLPLISVVIPTKDNPESFIECLVGALTQNYPKYEVVVVDSGNTPIEKIVEEARKKTEVPIRYIYFKNKGEYTLAEARNRGIIEADGEFILFCDDRIKMSENAVSAFEAHKKANVWMWGMKDDSPKGFVENFSFVPRKILIKGGMFCERMQWYGGMTQETRTRFEQEQGVNFVFLEDAKAIGIRRSHSKASRREDIIEAKYLIYKMYNK